MVSICTYIKAIWIKVKLYLVIIKIMAWLHYVYLFQYYVLKVLKHTKVLLIYSSFTQLRNLFTFAYISRSFRLTSSDMFISSGHPSKITSACFTVIPEKISF